jgi:two-component system, LuxR family, sensor kinase FixL
MVFMMATSSEEQEKQVKIEGELRQLTLSYEEMGRLVNEKANALLQSNRLLQIEIAERKKMQVEILEITQAEQKRFGSQLHDGLCQELTAILVFTKALTQKMEKEKTLEMEGLNKLSTMLLNAVDQARDTARGLYPGELEGSSLMHSLEELASQTAGVLCVFHCPEPILINDNNIATHLYKIAQEGISNAVKHGKARNIAVSFTRAGDTISLIIRDDGIGMSSELKNTKGIGLKIMKYRSQMINAAFHIKTGPSGGVILDCALKV